MSYATLLHGQPDDVLALLEGGTTDLQGLGMAMSNAFMRIKQLEIALQVHRDALSKACGDDPEVVQSYLKGAAS